MALLLTASLAVPVLCNDVLASNPHQSNRLSCLNLCQTAVGIQGQIAYNGQSGLKGVNCLQVEVMPLRLHTIPVCRQEMTDMDRAWTIDGQTAGSMLRVRMPMTGLLAFPGQGDHNMLRDPGLLHLTVPSWVSYLASFLACMHACIPALSYHQSDGSQTILSSSSAKLSCLSTFSNLQIVVCLPYFRPGCAHCCLSKMPARQVLTVRLHMHTNSFHDAVTFLACMLVCKVSSVQLGLC